MDFNQFLLFLSAGSILAPLFFYLWGKAYLHPTGKALGVFIFGAFLVELVSFVLAQWHFNNIWLLYLFIPFEFASLAYLVGRHVVNKINPSTPFVFAVGLIVVEMIEVRYAADNFNAGNLTRTVECVMLIVIALYAFYDLMQETREVYLQDIPLFWLAACILLYSAGNIFLFAAGGIESIRHSSSLWSIHSILNTLFNLILVRHILCLKPESRFR